MSIAREIMSLLAHLNTVVLVFQEGTWLYLVSAIIAPSLYIGLPLITVLILAILLETVKFLALHVEKFLGIPNVIWVIAPLIMVSMV